MRGKAELKFTGLGSAAAGLPGKERARASDGLLYASGQRLDEAKREEAAPPPFLMGPVALGFFYVASSFGKSQVKRNSVRALPNGEKLLILPLEGQRSVTDTPASNKEHIGISGVC